MKAFLDDLYYGNINPNEQSFRRDTEFDRAMKALTSSEQQLTAILEGAQKELLLQMINAQADIDGAIALEKFVKGLRLGARMMLEVLTEDERIFKDI